MGSKQSCLAKSPSKKEQKKATIEKQVETQVVPPQEKNDVVVEVATRTVEEEVQIEQVQEKIEANINSEMMIEEESSEDESDTESESEDDDEEEESEEELAERLLILEDARRLKALATAFLHPELPVQVDPAATARCYFDRPSAPEQEDPEEAEERAQILADAASLKKLATDYAHPEIGVVTTDSTACGRNYFDRPSAPEQETMEEAEERAAILEDGNKLREAAFQYLHPEVGVVTTDSTACGRNYFDRPSAPQQETVEEAEERAQILADATALKKLATDYAHPEIGVVTTDSTAYGRNYFDRPSAPQQEDTEEAEERAQILADAASLKKLATDYAHPEIGVVPTDSTACGRNYFNRPSAPEQETMEEAEERAQILADCAALKKLAIDYAHPEIGVTTTDATAFGRNYFTRPSAPQEEKKQVEIQEKKETVSSSRVVVTQAPPTKTIPAFKKEQDIGRSPSAVQLFGLGEDNNDAF